MHATVAQRQWPTLCHSRVMRYCVDPVRRARGGGVTSTAKCKCACLLLLAAFVTAQATCQGKTTRLRSGEHCLGRWGRQAKGGHVCGRFCRARTTRSHTRFMPYTTYAPREYHLGHCTPRLLDKTSNQVVFAQTRHPGFPRQRPSLALAPCLTSRLARMTRAARRS